MEELTKEEIKTLKTLCEFIFDEMYQYWATYERFELCFQSLFNNIEINLYKAYIGIVGKKKKYFTYPRFMTAYLQYKNNKEELNKNNPDLYKFFYNIFNNILKNINGCVGKHHDYSNDSKNNIISFSTKRGGKNKELTFNESFISKIQIINDNDERIRGIILEYDDINKFNFYPEEFEDDLSIGLEINLDIIQRKYFILNKKLNQDNCNMSLYRDSVTHIFGTIDKTSNLLTYLGFKCVSGKTRFFGFPDGEAFLFGEFGKKFFNLKLEINKEEGITLFEPGFLPNVRKNYVLNNIDDEINEIKIEDYLFEEKLLKNMEGDEYNKLLTTTIIENDKNFISEKDEQIPGYDYKEVIELSNREWIINKEKNDENFNLINSYENLSLEMYLNSSSDLSSGNLINSNENPEIKKIFAYNNSQNPFFPQKPEPEDIKPYNPFFAENEEKIRLPKRPLIIHKKKALRPNSEILDSKSKKCISNKIGKNPKLRDIFKKNSFKYLMEKLAKDIYEDFYEKNNSLIQFTILNEVVPNELDEREKTEKIKIKHKKNREFIINGKNMKLNDIKINEKINEILKENKEENLINSDAMILKNSINYDFEKFKKVNNKDNDEYWIKKWHTLSNLNKKWPRIIFSTMGKIIRAMIKVFKKDKKEISLKEKIEYYILLSDEENERIINFLLQGFEDNENKKEKKELSKDEPSDEQKSNSLEELNNSIKILKTQILIEKDKENRKSIKRKLNNLILEKNTYVENIINIEEEDIKDKIMKDKNLRAFLIEEKRKNGSWEAEEENKLIKSSIYISEIVKSEIQNKNKPFLYFHGQENISDEVDLKFKPNDKSLCPNMENFKEWPEKVIKSDIENWELIKWKKYNNIKMFSGKNSPQLDNIRQGEYIGDCYFLSALGSLCEKGDYLKNLVKKVKKGVYKVKLNINGKWKYVLVDNYYPNIFNNGKYSLCFGSSFKKELWVSLFEKAWAKVNGCYARIGCGGMCGEAFDILTDAYSEFHQILGINDEQKNNLWNKLKEANDNKYVTCAGTKKFGLFEGFGLFLGLISLHAYTIIKIYDKKVKGQQYKLIKLRNPWGEKEFNGDWSDKSSKWTDDLKRVFEFDEVKDDGIFYMSYDDFLKYFKFFEILKIKNNYGVVASCKIKKTEAYKCQMIEFEVKKNNEKTNNNKIKTVINLYQKNPRIIKKNGNDNYPPKPVKSFILLAKKESLDNYIYIKSISGNKAHIAIEADLEIGKQYIIFCDVNYRFVYDEIYGYNITFYSFIKNEIEVTNITNEINGKKRSEIFSKILYNYVSTLKEPEILKPVNKDNNLIDLYRINQFSEVFPFIILLIKYKDHLEPKYYKVYFSLELNKNLKEKKMCFYNDSEASEFDSYMIKQITNKNAIILIMGYTLTDVFSLSFGFHNKPKPYESNIFNDKYKRNNDGNLQHYIGCIDDCKGFILGIENVKNKDLVINIEFNGLKVINPEYDNSSNDEIQKIRIERGEKKEFHLRLKPGFEKFNYNINYLNH